MAAIAGIGASALVQFLQGLGSKSSPQTTSTANPNAPHRAAGPHRRHAQAAFKQIQSAVLSALQAAQASGASQTSGSTQAAGTATDPNQIIEDAIAKVLKSSIAAPGAAADGTSTGDSTGTTSGSTTPTTTGTTGPQTFKSILQSFGVTPEQFQNDFMSAIKDAQAGQVNPSTALQSFGAGSLLDVLG
jgi:hypothetical protein